MHIPPRRPGAAACAFRARALSPELWPIFMAAFCIFHAPLRLGRVGIMLLDSPFFACKFRAAAHDFPHQLGRFLPERARLSPKNDKRGVCVMAFGRTSLAAAAAAGADL